MKIKNVNVVEVILANVIMEKVDIFKMTRKKKEMNKEEDEDKECECCGSYPCECDNGEGGYF